MKIGGILILLLSCHLAFGQSNVQEKIDRKLKEDEMDESKGKQVLANTATILCLEFSWEFCGAFCEGHVACYTFDAKTGDVVNLKKLFTETGYEKVRTKVIEEWKNKITTGHSEESDDVQLMYSECAEAMTNDADQYFRDFYIEKSNLHFTGEHCGGPAYKSEDGEFDKPMSFAELKPYLSDYGKMLLK